MNIETQNYKIIEDKEYGGLQIQLFDQYNDEIRQVISKYNITSILLSQWKGWKSQPLDFLSEIENLKVVAVFDSNIKDLSIIEKLKSVEVLYLECPKAKVKIDFFLLKNLVDVRFDWRPCFSSICESETVQTIVINSFKDEDLSVFKSNSLTRLDIVKGSKLSSLNGIESAPNLKSLMLCQCSKLLDIEPLRTIDLESLELETCKKIEKLDLVFELMKLKFLSLDKCSSLTGIAGVSKLSVLKKLIISETTIENGSLAELTKLKGVEIFFDNKKNYSHTLEEIREKTR